MQIRSIQPPPLPVEGAQRREPSSVVHTPPAPQPQAAAVARHPLLSIEEQRYFETVFPETGADHRSTPAYTVAGAQHHTVPGTLVDRKG